MSQIIQNDKQFKKRESWQKWYLKNKDTRSKYSKEYHKNHPEVGLKSSIKQLKRCAMPFKIDHMKYRSGLMSWSNTVKKLYGKKCVVCGSTDKLHAHHILHKAKYPELSLNVNNGIPLCKQHHDEVHLRRGIN